MNIRSLLKSLFVCGFLLAPAPLAAQVVYATQDTAYIRAVESGLDYLKAGDCRSCLKAYDNAFRISVRSGLSMMRASICAMECREEQLAEDYIKRAVERDYETAESVWQEWQAQSESFGKMNHAIITPVIERVFAQKDASLGLNYALKKELEEIHLSDQQPRLLVDSLQRTYGQNSTQMQQLWHQMRLTDSLNILKVERILDQHGYPGKSLVGVRGMNTAWLVIQHAGLATQEKYLPLMQKAAEKGEMQKSNLALLIDRIRMYKGQKQLYGSQVVFDKNGQASFHPIEDEANVNERRKELGLEPLEEYAKRFRIKYPK